MKKILFVALGLCGLLAAAGRLHAQVTSLQDVYNQTPFDLQSATGVPITSTVNTNIGSDGLMTLGADNLPPTTNQFAALLSFGGLTAVTNGTVLTNYAALLAGTNVFSGALAKAMGLPTGSSNSTVVMVLRKAQIGGTYFSSALTYNFGSILPPPSVDDAGVLLTNNPTYWQSVPWSASNHTNDPFYYSPNAGVVFATQSGLIPITWITSQSYPVGTALSYVNPGGAPSFYTNGNSVFLLYTAQYIVTGVPVKPPQNMYWTEGSFVNIGHPIVVQSGRISAINVIFNPDFPETVATPYVDPYATVQTNTLQEYRTLWYDAGGKIIHAYNAQGLVFVELLGAPNVANNNNQFLGFELVNVSQAATPMNVPIPLGDQITPYADGFEGQNLTPSPLVNNSGNSYTYFQGTSANPTYYADVLTPDQNDLLIYWLTTGVGGLQWPTFLANYNLYWPTDPSQYSYYLRPAAATQAQAALTAVSLDQGETPSIDYQDPLDQPRGFLTANSEYYSWLTDAEPAHRALLRFNAGSNVRFERVFSVVNDAALQNSLLANSVFTNLDSYTAYLNYPGLLANYNDYLANLVAYTNYQNYTNYLATRNRGVNGVWNLVSGYNGDTGPAGAVGSWAVDIVTQGSGSGPLTTNEFLGTGFTYGTTSYNGSGLTVSGITNAVTAVLVKMSGVTNADPANTMAYLWSPLQSGSVFAVPGVTNSATNVNLVFNDAAAQPLTRFTSGSYLSDTALGSFILPAVQTVAMPTAPFVTNLPTAVPAPFPALTPWPSQLPVSDLVQATVNVGDRIVAPPGEYGSTNGTPYLAGYVNTNAGNAFNPLAYINPLAVGLAAANSGAIIPVNAIPGNNLLEVWWFRPNQVDNAAGFQTVYWPTVLGQYTIQWPTNAAQIVLANNAGSGPLDSLQASGTIYYQNDPTQPGYNPNEEHALMLGGQAYALRDDLNQTNANQAGLPFGGYSSAPFVLLSYTAADGRPAMSAYQVLRENPAAGQFFDYIVDAGQQVQAPMPLPLLPLPLAVNTNYPTGVTNYNQPPAANGGDLPAGWTAAAASGPFANYPQFTFQDRNNNFWVYRGPNAGLPPLQAGQYHTNNNSFSALPAGVALTGTNFNYYIPVSRLLVSLTVGVSNVPAGLALTEDPVNGLVLTGIPTSPGSNTVVITLADTDGSQITMPLPLTVASSGTVSALGPLTILSTNQYAGDVDTFVGRPPSLAQPATSTNSFTMNFYYQTMPGFAWPELGTNQSLWPAVGTIVPYLLPLVNGVATGDPTSANTPSLPIVYRPVWPGLAADGVSPLPQLDLGQTLTSAVNDLTAVRGQDSVQVLYQQAIATNSILTNTAASVVLYDPTSQKTSSLPGGLPASVVTDNSAGLNYFPNLPPNLISRFWYDPNQAKLVFQGQFVSDPVNGNYVMLNVLRGGDLAAVNGLCSVTDPNYSTWVSAVAALSTPEYTFGAAPGAPGSYVIQTNLSVTRAAGDLLEVDSSDTAVDSYALSAVGLNGGYVSYVIANDLNPKLAGDPVSIAIARVTTNLFQGNLVVANAANASPFSQLITFQHTADLAGQTSQHVYDWRILPPVNGAVPTTPETNWPGPLYQASPGPVYTLGAAGVQGLSDNYVSMRYGYTNGAGNIVWSQWANPILAPGWIKRVTQNLDPIAGSTQNLLQNPANTTASLIALAGSRWNGNVPLNAASLTNNGLIQLYETVLNTGEGLSINAGINYGPANQALLLAAGYLNDLYTILGNDAWANSQNPTIGFGTDNTSYGAIATSQFVFEGEEPTLLEQNLALLRGRNDSVSPGVTVPPVYNRLWWNYTYGIDAGETIYALNYNITDQNGDGVVNAADAAIMYPQGHGDAYGQYLTALMNYYKLLMNPNFDWVPQSEAVSVLGATVQVNYQDEQKFATTAAALARTGEQIFGLTFREGYTPGTAGGWSRFATNYVGNYTYLDNNNNPQPITGYWGLDHWGARVGQGTYLNWVVGNSLLPPVDPNPKDQGIQKVDRTTVQALQELPSTAQALETDLDNANAGFTPLGLAQNAIPFDLNPNQVTGANPQTHFQQVYARAVQALDNAVVAFNAAQNVTQELRQQQNSLSDLQAAVTAQEQAYNNQLIELYGTPYPDDVGTGQTYPQGYTGPDLIHYMYVDQNTNLFGGNVSDPTVQQTFKIDIQQLPGDWLTNLYANFDFFTPSTSPSYTENTNYISFTVNAEGFAKPAGWASERGASGSIQTAINAVQNAQAVLLNDCNNELGDVQNLDAAYNLFIAQNNINTTNLNLMQQVVNSQVQINNETASYNTLTVNYNNGVTAMSSLMSLIAFSTPDTVIAGLADGGNFGKVFAGVLLAGPMAAQVGLLSKIFDATGTYNNDMASDQNAILNLQQDLAVNQNYSSQLASVQSLGQLLQTVQGDCFTISQAQAALQQAQANYQSLLAQGNRLQQQRLTFRQQTAAKVQGATVANAAFLIFQNEDLERYNTLFNLAAEYAYMAANAFDYDTGLLNTSAGQSYLNQIISASALGVIDSNGNPQISGNTTGDPGLANALAEMKADYDALNGRLGFNNPDGYGTICSLRTENYRINADASGDNNWQQVLEQGLMADLRTDSDVMNHCLQIDDGSGQAVPGIELTFSTTVTDGQNLFGQQLAPGDHAFSASSFATKIFALGVDLDGYVGMDNPVSASGTGGTSPADPTLDPNGLAATPYVYLIPCGADAMRSPPLGDTSTIRTWNVDDVAIPLPFNIGASSFSQAPFYQAANSLTEPLFAVRKQQAFRPVSSLEAFNTGIYGATGSLQPSQYTNQRLIGRSVWNTKWKLIIPGKTLLADPNQGLARFINSVKDIHLYFVTYSYSGN